MRPLAPLGLSSLPQEFIASLPDFAVVVGLLALIWLACAVVATVGIYIAGIVFCAVRWIVHTCRRTIQRRWGPAYAHLVTIDSTGVRTRPVTARGARRWHTRPTTGATAAATDAVRDAAADARGNRESGNCGPGTLDSGQPDSDRGPNNDTGGEPS